MKTANFNNGDKMPILGLGTWLSKGNEVYDAVIEAIRIGYRHIDCAYIYRNEKEIGRALQDAMIAGLVKREELFITSKLWNSDHTPERVELAVRKSLRDLQYCLYPSHGTPQSHRSIFISLGVNDFSALRRQLL